MAGAGAGAVAEIMDKGGARVEAKNKFFWHTLIFVENYRYVRTPKYMAAKTEDPWQCCGSKYFVSISRILAQFGNGF